VAVKKQSEQEHKHFLHKECNEGVKRNFSFCLCKTTARKCTKKCSARAKFFFANQKKKCAARAKLIFFG